ncbi:prenyltransferase [Saccharopolyspora rectivirgula]|uniref:Prenyltransferase n=1 Tax=Saccharopolyspora rectivirgula TaxID=28042 RepID=A0A073B459_9PSEU|nr:prenyltransferase [Saccharopolyspora rectivirgula]KEI46072.1 prenyltransferase [Saccharopolyspora rectivirgula]
MPRPDVPAVPGVISAREVVQTAGSIADAQEDSGAIPWYPGGHTDPWDHVEAAMAMAAAGMLVEAERAYTWLLETQRSDGSWPLQVREGKIEDPNSDTNFCAYPAVGVWHHLVLTGDEQFAARMWPMVRSAIDFVLTAQRDRGEIDWAVDLAGNRTEEALLSGCASIYHSLRCALALARHVQQPRPDWEVALGKLGHAIRWHPEAFLEKSRYSMDWYYPVLGGVLRGAAGHERISSRWSDFVVDGLGARCVDDHPWVTGAETCELVLSLDALGLHQQAVELFASMQHLRDPDGSYWTGFVFADGKRWPEERTSWTSGVVVLAADALSRTTPANGIFRGEKLPTGVPVEAPDCCQLESV